MITTTVTTWPPSLNVPAWLVGEDGGSSPNIPPLEQETSRQRKANTFVVLLVEDNRADVLLVQEAIQAHQLAISLRVLSDGEQAFKYIERADAEPDTVCPDLIVLDLNLPKRSGKEVLQRLRSSQTCRRVPVLIISSADVAGEREELMKLGANGYFRKPTSFDQFLNVGAVLKELLEHPPGA